MKYSFLRFFLIFLCFINVSCAQTYMSEAENTVDLVIGELEQMLTKKYHLEAIGVSVSMPRGIVKKLGIDFNIEGPLSKDKLRSIIINSTKDFVDYINANQKIKSFLENYPFEFKNVEITLFLKNSNGYGIEHPAYGVAEICKGQLSYITVLYKNDIPNYEIQERETYEEAVKILQEQTANKSNSPM